VRQLLVCVQCTAKSDAVKVVGTVYIAVRQLLVCV